MVSEQSRCELIWTKSGHMFWTFSNLIHKNHKNGAMVRGYLSSGCWAETSLALPRRFVEKSKEVRPDWIRASMSCHTQMTKIITKSHTSRPVTNNIKDNSCVYTSSFTCTMNNSSWNNDLFLRRTMMPCQ